MAVRKDILTTEPKVHEPSARDTAFVDTGRYTERESFLKTQGIKPQTGTYEYTSDALSKEMSRLEENRVKVQKQLEELSTEFQRRSQDANNERGAGAAIFGSLGAGVVNVARTVLSTVERMPALLFEDNYFGRIKDAYSDYIAIRNDDTKSAKDVRKATRNLNKIISDPAGKYFKALIPGAIFKIWVDAAKESGTVETVTGGQLKPLEEKLIDYADVENEKWGVQLLAGAAQSLPASAATRIPYGIGWIILGISSLSNSYEQIKSRRDMGQEITPLAEHTYALGNMVLEIGTEMLFPQFGRFAKSAAGKSLGNATKGLFEMVFKKASKEVAEEGSKRAFGTIVKTFIKAINEEGLEEVFNAFGSGILSKLTVEKDAKLFVDTEDRDALISGMTLLEAYLQGAISAGVLVSPGATSAVVELRKVSNELGDKTLTQITKDDITKYYDNVIKVVNDAVVQENILRITEEIINEKANEVPTTEEVIGDIEQTLGQSEVKAKEKPAKATTVKRGKTKKSIGTTPFTSKRVKVTDEGITKETPTISKTETVESVPISMDRTAQKANISQSPTGNTVTSSLKTGDTIEVQTKLVDIKDLIASIDADVVKVQGFPEQYQNRETDSAAARKTVSDIAQKPDFFRLTMSETIGEGSPVVTSDGFAIAGNHRIAGFMKMMRDNPKNYKKYIEYLKENATKFGLNAEDVSDGKLLVRVLPEGADAGNIATITNAPTVRQMSASEMAKNDVNAINKILQYYVPNETGNVNSADNQRFVVEFMNNAMTKEEASRYMQADGSLNRDGVTRIENALFYAAYKSDKLLKLMSEATLEKSKRLISSMINVAPAILSFEQAVKDGRAYDFDIGGDIGGAGERYINLSNKKRDVLMYANNTEIGENEKSLREKHILIDMVKYSGSVKSLTGYLNSIIDVAKSAGDPSQQTLFDMGTYTLSDIVAVATERAEQNVEIETSESETNERVEEELGITAETTTEEGETKIKQFDVIQQSNPAPNDTQTWIRTADDVKTAKEVWGVEDYTGSTPDFTKADADKAIKSGKVKVYSSMPIKNGVFVTPSKIEAQNYAGEKTIYEKTVPLSDVAWIDDVQGQYAKLSVDKVPIEEAKPKKTIKKEEAKPVRSKKDLKKNDWIKDKDGEIYRIQSKESDGYNVQMYNPESKQFVMETFVEFKEIDKLTKTREVIGEKKKGKTKTTTKAETVTQPQTTEAELPDVIQRIVRNLPVGSFFNVHPITNKADITPMTIGEYTALYGNTLPEAMFRKGIVESKVIYKDVVYELVTPVEETEGVSPFAEVMNKEAEKKKAEERQLGIVSKEAKMLGDLVDAITGSRESSKTVAQDATTEDVDYKNMSVEDLERGLSNIIGKENVDKIRSNRKRAKEDGFFKRNFTKEGMKRAIGLGSVPIDLKYGDLRRLFRAYKYSKSWANQYASETINAIYKGIPSDQVDVFMDLLNILDRTDDIKLHKNSQSPYSMTPQQLTAAVEFVKNASEQNPVMFGNLMIAVEARRKVMRAAVAEFVAEAEKAGLDYGHLLLRKNYLFHDVLVYDDKFFDDDMPAEMKKIYKGKNKSGVNIKRREGSVKDYLTDTFILDWMSLSKMKRMTATVKVLAEMQRHDNSNNVTFDKDTGTMFLPEGYIQISPSNLGITNEQLSKTYIPHKTRFAFEKYAEKKGLKKGTKKYKNALYRYNRLRFMRSFESISEKSGLVKGSKQYWRAYSEYRTMRSTGTIIVPESFGDAVKTIMDYKETEPMAKLMRKAMNVWKWTKIRAPHAVFKYNMRNMFGDLDAVFAGNIKALSKLPKAWTDLYNFYKNRAVPPEFEQYMLRGGLLTGVSAVTMGDVYKLPAMNDYYKQSKGGLISEVKLRELIKKALLETPTEFREQLLRYAAYLQWVEDIQKDGRVKNYGASIPVEINNIRELHDKAFKLSNDLLGAYDDTSLFGQYLADHVIPFYRFTEINLKRYYRLFKNSFYTPDAVISEGMSVAKRLGLYGRIGAVGLFNLGRKSLTLSMFYGILALLNHLFAKDEDDKLPQSVKDSPHLVLPLGWVNDGKIHYIDRLGSFAELLDMFAIDYGMAQDIRDIVTGRANLKDFLRDSAIALPTHMINSAFPGPKFIFEFMSGQSYFPDPTKPSKIRDKGEYLANQLGLKTEYKLIKGMPMPQGNYWKEKLSILSSSVIPGDSAMWDVYNMKDRFMANYDMPSYRFTNSNRNSPEYKRSMALYYYKLALKLEDKAAADKYLKDYMVNGGTKNGMETSISWLDPRRGFNKADLRKFMEWMDAEELETFNEAVRFYEEFIRKN